MELDEFPPALRVPTRVRVACEALGSRGHGYVRGATAGALALAVALTGGCSTFEGLDLASSKLNREGGGADARGAGGSSACVPASVAPPPAKASSTLGDHDFVVAIRRYLFAELDGGRQAIGFDLDGKCTGPGLDGSSCRLPSWATEHADGPGGRDDTIELYYWDPQSLRAQAEQSTEVVNQGLLTYAIRVGGYNGTKNDDEVDVAFLAVTRSDSLSMFRPNPPMWDGSDSWTPLVEWIESTGRVEGGAKWTAKYVSSKAYVTNDTLVAHLRFALGTAHFNFSEIWIQGDLIEGIPGDGQWSLKNGIFAGRVKVDDLLADVEFSPDRASGTPYTCTDSPGYPEAKRKACALADIGSKGDDPADLCDAVSWQWMFDADPAKLGDNVDTTTAGTSHSCVVGKRPSDDRCATLGDGGS